MGMGSYFNWISEFLNQGFQILFQTRKQSQFHEETRKKFLGLKPIWNLKAEIPMSVSEWRKLHFYTWSNPKTEDWKIFGFWPNTTEGFQSSQNIIEKPRVYRRFFIIQIYFHALLFKWNRSLLCIFWFEVYRYILKFF